MSIKEASNNLRPEEWLKLFLIVALGIGCVVLISYFRILLFIFAFIGVFCIFAIVFILYLLFLYMRSNSIHKTISNFLSPIVVLTKWRTKIRNASLDLQKHYFEKSNETSQIDFYKQINRYALHNVKNSTKNLSTLVRQLQDDYPFSKEDNDLIDTSIENLKDTLTEFNSMADMKMQTDFTLQDLPNLLQKLHTSQFKRERIDFEIVYKNIDPNIIIHIPIYTLYQVFSNLIINAIEALSESEVKKIDMTFGYVQDNENQISIGIADTGQGITEEIRKKIFQIGISTKESSGVGLPYVVTVIQAYNGTVQLVNTGLPAPYKTLFIIQLPIKPIILTNEN